MISFSIIVPTCDRNDDLERCLDMLGVAEAEASTSDSEPYFTLSNGGFHYEVIVTDDGTQSNAEGVIRERFPRVKWARGPRRGPAANRNYGASQAKGDWLLFIDDDCIPGKSWLQGYVSAVAAAAGCSVFEGRTIPIGKKKRADQECPINLQGGNLWSCNFLIKRQLFFDLGGFDEKFPFPFLEDIDFQRRLSQAGQSIRFVFMAEAEHPWRIRRGMAFCVGVAKSVEYFITKYPAAKKVFIDTWGMRRLAKIFLFEFPNNLFHYPDFSSFRALYLDLLTAFHVSLALNRQRI
jgi:GT2 family glycosyltransferase